MRPGAVLTLTAALVAGAAVPAVAGSTTVTCTVVAGGLSLGEHAGVTTVADHRGSFAGWTTSIAMLGGGTATAYVAVGDGPTVTSGSAVATTPYRTPTTALTISAMPQPFVSATTTGSNTVTYIATVAGAGNGGFTQSVS